MKESNLRFTALDELRGFTIASMILVNTPGSWSYVWPPFGHADWHGLTFADFVFPWFLMISGMGLAFSLHYRRLKNGEQSADYFKLFKRVSFLFLIGLGLNWFPFTKEWEQVRIFGILQRIALAYGMAAVIILALKESARNIVIVSVLLLFAYWALLFFGGDGEDPLSLTGNLMRKVDLLVLGESHMYKGEGIAFDPEGLIGTISASVNVLIGFIVASFLIENPERAQRMKGLFISGILMIIVGYLFDFAFPINKKIWTSSFVLVSCGYGLVILATMISVESNRLAQKMLYPFRVFGLNPLFCFVLSVFIVKVYFLFQFEIAPGEIVNTYTAFYKMAFVPLFNYAWGSFFFALFHVVLVWFVAWPLYKNKIVIKL